jgi:hypothetical protein
MRPSAPARGVGRRGPKAVEPVVGGDRRLDRVLDPGFLTGLEELDLEELRERRELAEAEEVNVSYFRRLLQGRLDIIRAELERRAAGGDRDVRGLLRMLPTILADERTGSFGAMPRVPIPSRADQHRRRVERLVSDETVTRLPELGNDELQRAVEQLTKEEARVSATRRSLHGVIDQLRGELTRRYRLGTADVNALLERQSRRSGA